MGIRRRINRKGLSQKPSTPNPDILQHFLQSRPFGDGKKVRSPQLPTSADIFRTRPFAPHKPQSAPPEEMPDVQAQLNSGEEFGYIGFNMPAFAPESALPIQAKLTIGEPNDPYEQEADAVAAQVVSQINSPPPQESAASQTVQREDMVKEDEDKPVQTSLEISTIQRDEMPAPEEEEEDKPPLQAKSESGTIQREEMPAPEEEEEDKPPVQAKLESGTIQRDEMPPPEEEEDKPPLQAKLESGTIQRDEMPPPEEEEDKPPLQAKLMVQRKSGEGGMAATPDLENSIESARGSGQSLSENIREPMEQAFGADFSGVKVHTDGQSDQLNQSIQARAFTTGQDIFFRQGQYDPGSKGGQELLAHELTHVVQQNGGAVQPKLTKPIQTKPTNSDPKESSEYEADVVANQVDTVPVSESSTTDIHGDWLTDAVSAVGDAASAIGNAVKGIITKAELQEIFAKGAAMTPEEAAQAKKLLFQLSGDDFREILKEALKSGAFLDMLSKLDFWEIINTVANLTQNITQEVVVPTTLLNPATNTIEDDFKRANEIYNPHGIEIEKGDHVDISEATTKTLLGGDTELDEFTTNQATAEELKLMEENRTKGRITGYWVPSMPSSRGEALTKDHLTNMLDDRTSVVVNTQDRAQDTFAHELGHTLGLPHEDTDANNLMASGSTRNITGPGIDKLSDAQLDIIRKSLFMELGKKGVGQ